MKPIKKKSIAVSREKIREVQKNKKACISHPLKKRSMWINIRPKQPIRLFNPHSEECACVTVVEVTIIHSNRIKITVSQ